MIFFCIFASNQKQHKMILDYEMLKSFYSSYNNKVAKVKGLLGRPLTYAEKVLYAHLFDENGLRRYERGTDYVDFRPDRVAMQDATAQMALLQFMNAGKDRVAVPASVHCDHLIKADAGADSDLPAAMTANREVYDFLRSVSARYHRARASYIRWCSRTMPFPEE